MVLIGLSVSILKGWWCLSLFAAIINDHRPSGYPSYDQGQEMTQKWYPWALAVFCNQQVLKLFLLSVFSSPPLTLIIEALTLSVTIFGDKALREVIKVNWRSRGLHPNLMKIRMSFRRGRDSTFLSDLAFLSCAQRKGRTRTRREGGCQYALLFKLGS